MELTKEQENTYIKFYDLGYKLAQETKIMDEILPQGLVDAPTYIKQALSDGRDQLVKERKQELSLLNQRSKGKESRER